MGWTPLYAAAQGGHIGIMRLLAAAASAATGEGFTAMHIAAVHGRAEAVSLLLSLAPACTRCSNELGCLPIHLAARHVHRKVLQQLLAAAPETALATTLQGFTPLHYAALRSQPAAVPVLVAAAPAALSMHGDSGFNPSPLCRPVWRRRVGLPNATGSRGAGSIHCCSGQHHRLAAHACGLPARTLGIGAPAFGALPTDGAAGCPRRLVPRPCRRRGWQRGSAAAPPGRLSRHSGGSR
ncbi:hypothetical protein ABPG75_014069 [Micractinium tetrahymenae]